MRKKKTHEEYVTELAIKNPTVEVVGKYVDAQTKIVHHCLLHDVYWEALPGNILAGKGCRECTKEKNRNHFVKSHDEYVKQVKEVNPDIVVLEQYINSYTPILHWCKKHDVKWKPIPSNILKGYGCKECGNEKFYDKKCKKHDNYVEELAAKNPTVEVIEQYIDGCTPILHRCLIHGICWKMQPGNALRGDGCWECRNDKVRNKLIKTHNEYVYEVSIKNPTVEVIEQYMGNQTKILHHCLIHDVYWKSYPSNVLKGCGCFECCGEKIRNKNCKTHEEYVSELMIINSNIVALEQYIDMKTPILHMCLNHNIKWETTPSSTLQGCGCFMCRSEKISDKLRKTHEQYVEELKLVNPNIIILENYIDALTPILHKCLIDGNEWLAKPSNILIGYGCPQCNESRGERKVRQWLEKHDIKFKYQMPFDDCRDIKPLPFDFYLLELNICIEYDGIQHYEPIEYFGGEERFYLQQKHDQIKTDYCKNNNIKLLRIPYYANIEEELNNFLFI